MLVAVVPLSSVKLNGFGIAAVIAVPLVLKFVRIVDKGEIAHGGAHGSIAVGVANVATGLHAPRLMLAGHDMIGSVAGGATMLKLQVDVAPEPAVARKVTTLVPVGNVDPLGSPAICVTTTGGEDEPVAPDCVKKLDTIV